MPCDVRPDFPHLNHQAKKANLSFYRVIGILLPFLMAFRQHHMHSAVEKPRRLCCTLAHWADMG